MIFSLLKGRPKRHGIEPLYQALMRQALDPSLFLAHSVPDTFEARFEMVALHAGVLLRRLASARPPADEMAQELVDRIFDGLDSAMRESGISDVGVPKRMKVFASGFYGRLKAYDTALAAGDRAALGEAISRNVLDGGDGAGLAAHAFALADALMPIAADKLAKGAWPKLATGEQIDAEI